MIRNKPITDLSQDDVANGSVDHNVTSVYFCVLRSFLAVSIKSAAELCAGFNILDMDDTD